MNREMHTGSRAFHGPKRERDQNRGGYMRIKKKKLPFPNVLYSQAARLRWILPRMSSPWALAPVPVPQGLSSATSQNIIRTTWTSIWTRMNQFKFDVLPFLNHNEMEHLACCLGFLPDPGEGTRNFFHLFIGFFVTLSKSMARYSTDDNNKIICYALVRQTYYNAALTKGCRRDDRVKEKQKRGRQQILGLAAMRIPVLIKLIEACVRARRAYLDFEPSARFYAPGISPGQGRAISGGVTGTERRHSLSHYQGFKPKADLDSESAVTKGEEEADKKEVKIEKHEDHDDVYIKVEDEEDASEDSDDDDDYDDDDVTFKTEGSYHTSVNFKTEDSHHTNTDWDLSGQDLTLIEFTRVVDMWIRDLNWLESHSEPSWTAVFGDIGAGSAQAPPQPTVKTEN